MIIGMNDVRDEKNDKLGLDTDVLYFTLPGLDFAGMVRRPPSPTRAATASC